MTEPILQVKELVGLINNKKEGSKIASPWTLLQRRLQP